MQTIFINTENSKTNESLKYRLALADKSNLKDSHKNMALANLSIYYTWINTKCTYNNNKLKYYAPTSDDEFDLSDGSYSISDIQDFFSTLLKT